MSKPIDNIHDGLDEVKKVLCEFLGNGNIDQSRGNGHGKYPKSMYDIDLPGLIIEFQKYLSKIKPDESEKTDYYTMVNLGWLIKGLRNLDSHYSVNDAPTIKDRCFIASALDTMRRFIELLLPSINQHRDKENKMLMPEFEYWMDQPADSRRKVVPENMLKSKSYDYIPVRPASFDLGKLKVPLTKHTMLQVINGFGIIKPGESILIVRTMGDVFLFDKNLEGYTGDWDIDTEVDKIMIIHFYEGETSTKAHVYLGDYVGRKLMTGYTSDKRCRYYFNNLLSCGDIVADFTLDFGSFERYPKE